MTRLGETVTAAFSMFSALPVPQTEWKEDTMHGVLAAFPLVGATCGFCWWGVCALSEALALPALLRGALLCAMPAVLTGGIHLDGYADTQDALASHAPPERKREILSDPHCGAFAVIRLCVYFTVWFALCCVFEPSPRALWCACLAFPLSRALSGLALTVLPLAKNTGLAYLFASGEGRKRLRAVLSVEAAVCALAMLWLGGWYGAAALCAAALVLWSYARTAAREFGGVSGDLAGWFLVKAEFWMLAAAVAARYGERLL